MDAQYMDIATNLLLDMRLKIEGAVDLYECDGLPLRHLAIENDIPVPACAYDTIGSALYDLREHIRELQEVHMKKLVHQVWNKPTY